MDHMSDEKTLNKDGWFLGTEPLTDPYVNILGIRFNRVAMDTAIERILYWVSEKSRRMVITAGPEFVMKTQNDEHMQKIAQCADLVTADGIGVVWAAARSGKPVPERVTGVEMVLHLFEAAKKRHQPLRVFILGAAEQALTSCLRRFRVEYPDFTFEGHNGYFNHEHADAIIHDIQSFQPDIWLVGLGQPRQEQFIYEHLAEMPPCVAVGIGGSIDVWSGTVKRAPAAIQKLNLEWLYRLLKQPSRLGRQMALPRFAIQVLRDSKRTVH